MSLQPTCAGHIRKNAKMLENQMRYLVITLTSLFMAASAVAQSPILVDPQTGRYLGNLNSNQYDPNSVANPYGRYGSEYSPDSINNPYGQYGSPYSPNSARNPYATNPPIIVAPQGTGSGFNGGFGYVSPWDN
jgi:hypothetical protein